MATARGRTTDVDVAATVRTFYRIVPVFYLALLGCWAAAYYWVVGVNLIVAVVVLGATLFLWVVLGVDVRNEATVETDRPVEAVRSEFARLENPVTAFAVNWADEVTETAGDASTAPSGGDEQTTDEQTGEERSVDEPTLGEERCAVLGGTFFGVFRHSYRLRVRRTGEDAFEIRFGDDGRADGRVVVALEPTETGTRVGIRSRSTRVRVTKLLLSLVQRRYERRVLETYGYRPVESSVNLDLRLG